MARPAGPAPLPPALHRRIIRAYRKPGHPVAFSAPGTVAEYFGISKSQARRILEHVEGYTVHREYKKPETYNPYYVDNRRQQVQADLIDVSNPLLVRKNRGVTFLLLLIDIMTKKVWMYALKNKSASVMKRMLTRWLNQIDTPPKVLRTDHGTEFKNNAVQQLLASRGVEWQGASGTMKACIAERVNKTMQVLIYKFMSDSESHVYIDKLPALVRTYNERKHNSLDGMTPNEADRPKTKLVCKPCSEQGMRRFAGRNPG